MIERIDTENGRFYRTPDGNIYPSVTTVLTSIPNPALEEWKLSIGEEKAAEVSKKASEAGTLLHSYCESYLTNGTKPKLDMFQKFSYSGLGVHLDKIKPIAVESMMYSDKLRVAGTIDCLGYYDGVPHIIDFKSTSRDKYDGEFDTYWLQTAAYSMMVYERFDMIVPDLLIIMQNLLSGECNVYKQKSSVWLPRFKQIRDAYENKSTLLS